MSSPRAADAVLRTDRAGRGQALVEFTLVTPVFLLMLFGLLDLGRVVWANDVVANAAREGARWASVHGISDMTTPATKQQIKSYTLNFAVAAGAGPQVTVCYSAVNIANGSVRCSGDSDEAGAANARGNMVTVSVTSTVSLVTASLLGLGSYTISSSSTMMINN